MLKPKISNCIQKAIDKFIDYEIGLRDGKVKRVSKGMRDKGGYWYKNETLIEKLDISIEEQRELETIIGTKVKYERNNARRTPRNVDGLTAREQQKQDKVRRVLELKAEGKNNSQIAKEIGISRVYVSKVANGKV